MTAILREWLHSKEEVVNRRMEYLSILMNQYRQARVKVPDCPICGKEIKSIMDGYRCFQCDLWLCKSCTKSHMPEVNRK